jgi:hypothetical protein
VNKLLTVLQTLFLPCIHQAWSLSSFYNTTSIISSSVGIPDVTKL